jgi:alkylhydroperoxidase/carboxymuconolactone decarboxylase family protein YurZ
MPASLALAQRAHGSSGAALLGHSFGTGGLGFGDQAPEIKLHVRGAINNGLSVDDIKEVLLHATVYCGNQPASMPLRPPTTASAV